MTLSPSHLGSWTRRMRSQGPKEEWKKEKKGKGQGQETGHINLGRPSLFIPRLLVAKETLTHMLGFCPPSTHDSSHTPHTPHTPHPL